MKKELLLTCLVTILLNSCGIVQKDYKYSFADGYYRSKIFNEDQTRVYIDNNNDSILIYSVSADNKVSNNLKKVVSLLQEGKSNLNMNSLVFNHLSMDVDVLTILSKYRPETVGLPGQLNSNLNGSVYLGLRNDVYQLKYPKTPLNTYKKQIKHYGLSSGIFTGLGGSPLNPAVTENHISHEYDGLVWSNGFAVIMGVNNASLGILIGWDQLLDSNKEYWIYQGKPWLGIALGLNLN
jgi:hypothetical protein